VSAEQDTPAVILRVPFAQVPEWLLDADISDRAVRLYARLVRYAGSNGKAWPGRDTLARRLRCSEASVDRALKELREVGALTVKRRGLTQTNLYIIEAVPGAKPESPEVPTQDSAPMPNERESVERDEADASSQSPSEPKKPRARNLYFDALVELFGPATTRARASFYGSTAGQLKEAGATPDEVLERGRRMLAKGWTDAGPGALVKHWDSLSADPASAYAGQPPARPAPRPDPRRP